MAIKNDATVLAFEKKLVSSDGYLYGTTWKTDTNWPKSSSLKLIEKSVRGTISNRLKPAVQNDPLKLNAEVEKPNLQKVDACALGEDQDTLHLSFTLKVLGGVEKPSASNGPMFNASYPKVAQAYIEQAGFKELVFSANEIIYCEARTFKYEHYAARFAAKEAFFKALGTGWKNGTAFNEIEIVNNEAGKPEINFLGNTAATIAAMGLGKISVSLSHLKTMATAIVIIENK